MENEIQCRVLFLPSIQTILLKSQSSSFKEEPKRPFVNDNNIIMYLDMIHEKIVELKGVAQFIDFQVIV